MTTSTQTRGEWGITQFKNTITIIAVVFLTFAFAEPLPTAEGHTSGTVLSAFGTATVDGAISPGEYGSCIGPITQGSYELMFCETNDITNNYYAIRVGELTRNRNDTVYLLFDNENDGAIKACGGGVEDFLILNANNALEDSNACFTNDIQWPLLTYQCVFPGVCLPNLTYKTASGFKRPLNGDEISHGVSAVNFNRSLGYLYEMSHPLDSKDPQDYLASPDGKSVVGFCLLYDDADVKGPQGEVAFPKGCASIDGWITQTEHPAAGVSVATITIVDREFRATAGTEFGDIVMASPPSPIEPLTQLLSPITTAGLAVTLTAAAVVVMIGVTLLLRRRGRAVPLRNSLS